MCPSLIEIGSKTAERNSAQTKKQTNRQTDRKTDKHCENNGHLAVNQKVKSVTHLPLIHSLEMKMHYCTLRLKKVRLSTVGNLGKYLTIFAERRTKFATTPYDITCLTLGMLLLYCGTRGGNCKQIVFSVCREISVSRDISAQPFASEPHVCSPE